MDDWVGWYRGYLDCCQSLVTEARDPFVGLAVSRERSLDRLWAYVHISPGASIRALSLYPYI